MEHLRSLVAVLGALSAALACDDTIADHPLCTFGSQCSCEQLIAEHGCDGAVTSAMGSTAVSTVCCGACACEDTLAQTASPIKECAVLVASCPCGTECWGTDVDDVCKKTCGLCGGMLDTDLSITSTTPPPGQAAGTHKVYLSPPFQSEEYTVFDISSDSVMITSVVPADVEWFGYIFFTYTQEVGDPTASLAYYFTVQPDGSITYRAFWLTYFGPTSGLGMTAPAPVWECTSEAHTMSQGQVCQFNDTTGEGDFMVGTSGVTLGMRPQSPAHEDINLLNVTSDGSWHTIVWSRSRKAPFHGDTVQVRYASAPAAITSDIDTVLGFKYHGYQNRYSSSVELASSQQESFVVDGFVQHQWISDDTVLVGSGYGWNNPPPGASRYADIGNATVGTTLRFIYLGFRNIALYPNASALASCAFDTAIEVGGQWDSPFELSLTQAHVGQVFIGASTTTAYANGTVSPLHCNLGSRFTVTVSDTSGESDDISGELRSTPWAWPVVSAMTIFAATVLVQ